MLQIGSHTLFIASSSAVHKWCMSPSAENGELIKHISFSKCAFWPFEWYGIKWRVFILFLELSEIYYLMMALEWYVKKKFGSTIIFFHKMKIFLSFESLWYKCYNLISISSSMTQFLNNQIRNSSWYGKLWNWFMLI